MVKKLVTIITANSNSGSYCVDEIYDKFSDKLNVRAIFRTEDKAKPFREKYPNMKIITGVDASKPETLSDIFKGSDYSLIVTPHDPTQPMDNDAFLTMNMIIQAVEQGVKYIVLVTSFTVEQPDKLSLLAARFIPSEKLLEKLGEEKGIKWTVLRGGVFMENVLPGFSKNLKEGSTVYWPNIIVPYIDTQDIGKSAAACFASDNIDEHNKKYYEMNGPEIINNQKLAEILSNVLNRKITCVELVKDEFKKFMPEAVTQCFEYMLEYGEDAAPFTDDVKKITGQSSSFEQFFKRHIQKFQ